MQRLGLCRRPEPVNEVAVAGRDRPSGGTGEVAGQAAQRWAVVERESDSAV